MCFEGLRGGKEGTLKSVPGSQLLYLGATLAQAGPARFTLASLSSLAAGTLYLALLTPGGVTGVECHTGAPTRRLWVSWLCCHVDVSYCHMCL